MENTFVKVALYAYPFLETVDIDYQEHIQTKALLSYRGNKTAEQAAVELALEIVERDKLIWLKRKIECALLKLDDTEKTLIAIRYFGKRRTRKNATVGKGAETENLIEKKAWSERKYFRVQNRLCEKMRSIFVAIGIGKEFFEREYAEMELFKKLYGYVEKRGAKVAKGEMEALG